MFYIFKSNRTRFTGTQFSMIYWETSKGQIPLRYPASEPARELVCDLLDSWSQTCSELEFGLSLTI